MTVKEVLVLDSNIFFNEIGLTSRSASALKHYLYLRKTKLVVPAVVAEECERILANKVKGKNEKSRRNFEMVGTLLRGSKRVASSQR